MQALCLVDYDNVRPIQREIDDSDAAQNVFRIADRATTIVKDRFPGTGEVLLRLYGGWTHRNGQLSVGGLRLSRALPMVERRVNGLRVNPELVKGPIFYDCSLNGLVKDGEQKMVDSLIVADMTWAATQLETPILLMSDDDDMLPGLICALVHTRDRRARQPVCLSRTRASGAGMNDRIIIGLGVSFEGGV